MRISVCVNVFLSPMQCGASDRICFGKFIVLVGLTCIVLLKYISTHFWNIPGTFVLAVLALTHMTCSKYT